MEFPTKQPDSYETFNKLSKEERIDLIRQLRDCPGWTRFFKPFLEDRIDYLGNIILQGVDPEAYESLVLSRNELIQALDKPDRIQKQLHKS